MFVTGKHLDRRTFLRGAGVALSLPLLDSMIPAFLTTRAVAAARARRFAVVYFPNGLYMPNWEPKVAGPAWEVTPILKPLAALREHLVVVSGLTHQPAVSLPGEGSGDHLRASASFLTGVHCKKTEGPDIRSGVSMDQIAARELGKQTQLAALEMTLEALGFPVKRGAAVAAAEGVFAEAGG
jgi:hypothetical protein